MATRDISAILIHECSYCGRMFRSKWQLSDHVRRKHEEKKPYKCELCPKDFIKNSDLEKHRWSHSNETPFKCIYCTRAFKTKQGHKIHEDTHGFNRYNCPYCDRVFDSYRKLYMHKHIHKNSVMFDDIIANYECSFCYFTFSTYQFKIKHEVKFHSKLILANKNKREPKKKSNKVPVSQSMQKLNKICRSEPKKIKAKPLDSSDLACPVCSTVLNGRSEIIKHAQKMHPGDARPHIALILRNLTKLRTNRLENLRKQ